LVQFDLGAARFSLFTNFVPSQARSSGSSHFLLSLKGTDFRSPFLTQSIAFCRELSRFWSRPVSRLGTPAATDFTPRIAEPARVAILNFGSCPSAPARSRMSPSNRAGRPACCARSRCSLSTILIQFSRCPKPGRAKSASVLIISARLGGFSVLKCSLSAQTPV
jgi:hypothetical protein